MTRVIAVLLLLTGSAAAGQFEPPGPLWREAPAFRTLFASAGLRANAYRTYVSPMDLDSALQALLGDASLLRPPGAWVPQALLPLDAFGQTGAYDRWAVLRLYSAQRARVARGPRAEAGRVLESWTLVSPFPDAALHRLEPGTLLIVLRIP